jgi:hypothetical protein
MYEGMHMGMRTSKLVDAIIRKIFDMSVRVQHDELIMLYIPM